MQVLREVRVIGVDLGVKFLSLGEPMAAPFVVGRLDDFTEREHGFG